MQSQLQGIDCGLETGFPALGHLFVPPLPHATDVVVGLGNEIARDDGLGIAAARRLEQRLAPWPEVEVVPLPWAGFALLDVLTGRRRAVLVDCLITGAHAPGTIVRFDERDLCAGAVHGCVRLVSFHDLDLATVLGLGRRLGWAMPEELAVWAVEGDTVDEFGEGLSPAVESAVERVVEEVVDFLGRPPGRPQGAA